LGTAHSTLWKAFVVFVSATIFFVGCAGIPDLGTDRQNAAAPGSSSAQTTGGGTNDDGAGPTSPSAPGVPCEVDKIVRSNCQTCHGAQPSSGASVPLVTYDDYQRDHNGKKVYELVGEFIHNEGNIMPPAGKLKPQDLTTLDTWIGAGAPESPVSCNLPAAPSAVKPLSCKANVSINTPAPFTMPNIPLVHDYYMCYGASDLVTKKRHIVGFAPHIGNPKIVHHVLLFKSLVPVPPVPFPCTALVDAAWQVQAGWAPGAGNLELPPEAGIPDDIGLSNWVVQIHYNDGGGKYGGETDQTGYDMCATEELRPNDAGVVGFGTIAIAIPPRSKLAMDCTFLPGPLWWGKHFFTSFAHMHGRGTALSTTLQHLFSGTETVSDYEGFNFSEQGFRPAKGTVGVGDVIRTRCAWTNTSDELVTFGENTDNEMCFNFVGYYPAIPEYPWITPSLATACIPSIGR
jgi:hypothetical protein